LRQGSHIAHCAVDGNTSQPLSAGKAAENFADHRRIQTATGFDKDRIPRLRHGERVMNRAVLCSRTKPLPRCRQVARAR
jgi:hypothetical protein